MARVRAPRSGLCQAVSVEGTSQEATSKQHSLSTPKGTQRITVPSARPPCNVRTFLEAELREVIAQIGCTRFEPAMNDID